MNSQEVSIRNLENQVGQVANAINNRPQGTLSSDTEINPRSQGQKHYKSITLQSGKELQGTVGAPMSKSQTARKEDIDTEKENNKSGDQEKKAREDPA